MYQRITSLYKHTVCLSNADFLLLINKWDDELTNHMKYAENKCNTYKHCHIEWSPEVGVWLQRWWLLARVLQFMKGEIPGPQNLIRDCNKHNLEDPRLITLAQLHLEIHICNLQITELHKTVPQKRHEHLTSCIKEAEVNGDKMRKHTIIAIIRKEVARK